MVVIEYDFADFVAAGGTVNVAVLDEFIRASAIANTLNGVSSDDGPQTVSIDFVGSLSGGDQTILDTLVATHIASPETVEADVFSGDIDLSGSNILNVGTINSVGFSSKITDYDSHVSSSANPHGTDLFNIGSGTLGALNAKIQGADLIASSSLFQYQTRSEKDTAGGYLGIGAGGGVSIPGSTFVTGTLRVTNDLVVTASATISEDLTVEQDLIANVSNDLEGTLPAPNVVAFHSGTTRITFDNIPDGTLLIRNGNTIQGTTGDDSEFFSGYDSAGGTSTTSTTFVDIPLGGENKKTSAFTHGAGAAVVTINVAGTYVINGHIGIEQSSGNNRTESQGRLVIDTGGGFTEVPGTRVSNYSRNSAQDGNTGAFSVVLDLSVGDQLKLQLNRQAGSATIVSKPNGSGLTIFNVRGPKGEKGDTGSPGAGSNVVVENDNTIVTGAAGILNFGPGFDVTNDGGGQVTIDPVFGDQFNFAESLGVSTTTSTTFQTKLTIGALVLPAGTYRIDISYGWNADSTSSDFEGQVQEDSGGGFTTLGEIHKQEPQDSAGTFSTTASDQRHYLSRTYIRALTAGTYTWRFQWRASSGGVESSCWDVVIAIYRVSS